MLHRESLATKEMSTDLADVMDTVVKPVNCIKKSALQTRLFASLCAATGEEHNTLLYHSEVSGFPVEQYWHASLNYAQVSMTFY